MHTETLVWAEDPTDPLVQHFCFSDPAANAVIVGTGHFKAGQVMPVSGFSQYPMREISIIIEGAIQSESGGKSVTLRAGDIVTIPANQKQMSRFLEDTKLVYVFFGHRGGPCEADS